MAGLLRARYAIAAGALGIGLGLAAAPPHPLKTLGAVGAVVLGVFTYAMLQGSVPPDVAAAHRTRHKWWSVGAAFGIGIVALLPFALVAYGSVIASFATAKALAAGEKKWAFRRISRHRLGTFLVWAGVVGGFTLALNGDANGVGWRLTVAYTGIGLLGMSLAIMLVRRAAKGSPGPPDPRRPIAWGLFVLLCFVSFAGLQSALAQEPYDLAFPPTTREGQAAVALALVTLLYPVAKAAFEHRKEGFSVMSTWSWPRRVDAAFLLAGALAGLCIVGQIVGDRSKQEGGSTLGAFSHMADVTQGMGFLVGVFFVFRREARRSPREPPPSVVESMETPGS